MVYVHYDPRDFFPRRSISIGVDPEEYPSTGRFEVKLPTSTLNRRWLNDQCTLANHIFVKDGTGAVMSLETNVARLAFLRKRCKTKMRAGDHVYTLFTDTDANDLITAEYKRLE